MSDCQIDERDWPETLTTDQVLIADGLLTKPVDPDRLLRECLALLRRTPEELRHRREQGLADARRLDAMAAPQPLATASVRR